MKCYTCKAIDTVPQMLQHFGEKKRNVVTGVSPGKHAGQFYHK